MTKRRVSIVVLCEDLQQEVFARKFLMCRGFDSRKIEIKTAPKGKGSAEQYVRERYPLEVKTYRKESRKRAISLAVIIDADTKTVQEHLTELDSELKNSGQSNRQSNEKIAIFVPKRNIETWIHYLMGESVDEEITYPKFNNHQSECKPYVEHLANICVVGLPADAPPSLHEACKELPRIMENS